MNFFSIISVFLFMLYLQAGFFVLLRSRDSRLNILFFLLSICFSIWSFAYIFVYSASTAEQANFWDGVASFGYCLFPAFMVYFNIELCNCKKSKNKTALIFYGLLIWGLILFTSVVTDFWRSPEITRGIFAWHFKHDTSNVFQILFYIYLSVSAIITFSFLIWWRLRITEEYEKKQFNLYFYPLIIFFISGVTIDLVFPAFGIKYLPNIGHISSLPWILGITYAMYKFQLMTISSNNLISDIIIKQLKEIVLFIDTNNKIVRSNLFTKKLLQRTSNSLEGALVIDFFENDVLLLGFLRKADEKGQLGPVILTLKDDEENLIETSLSFIAIKDKFDDMQGYIIYGHDNNEAINLKKEIIVREQAEKNLRAISEVLEVRVKERTAELTASYKELQIKMTDKMRVEEKIKADIAEKEVLINEIHNRVKHNMNIIISLILAYDKDNLTLAASKKFKELSRRVKSLLLIHDNLYLSITYSDVDFSNYIRSITEELVLFYKRKEKVEIRYEVSDVFLDVDYAIPLGLIVNELVSNSLQHGFSDYYLKKNPEKKNIILVKYTYENGNYEIVISDNGKGLPKGFEINDLTTNGLPLSDILVKDQMNGSMKVFSSDDGTMFKITFFTTK